MKGHEPHRTCIGCRGSFQKKDVIRVVAGPAGMAIDYREKLPGRGAYVCPRRECIEKALGRGNLSRALHRTNAVVPSAEEFIIILTTSIREKITSLLLMAAKAGKLAAGYSAVRDALGKETVGILVFAGDCSDGTREKLLSDPGQRVRYETLFTKDTMGAMFGREQVGVLGIEDRGFADAIGNEFERLKSLIK